MMDGYHCQSVREQALIKHRPFDYDNAMTRYILDKPEGRISENDISIANELITSGQILAFDIRNSRFVQPQDLAFIINGVAKYYPTKDSSKKESNLKRHLSIK